MSEIAERFRRRADAFEVLIAGTAPERWESPSPCEGWLARDIVAHILEFSTWEMPSSVASTLRDEAGMPPPPSGEVVGDPAAAFRAIREAVQRLPAPYRLVVIAVMWHDFAPSEVAELLGVPAGRVRVHLFRALKLVEKELSGP